MKITIEYMDDDLEIDSHSIEEQIAEEKRGWVRKLELNGGEDIQAKIAIAVCDMKPIDDLLKCI